MSKKNLDKRKIRVRLPSSKVKIHYEKKKQKRMHCAVCKKPLLGMPNVRFFKLHSLPKSQKRPSRPYAGTLCSRCLREKLKEKVRSLK